jgi:hypothetical protein
MCHLAFCEDGCSSADLDGRYTCRDGLRHDAFEVLAALPARN